MLAHRHPALGHTWRLEAPPRGGLASAPSILEAGEVAQLTLGAPRCGCPISASTRRQMRCSWRFEAPRRGGLALGAGAAQMMQGFNA